MESGASKDTAADFESAKRIFLELGDYRDSAERAQKCAETAEEIYERERRKNAARIAAAEAAAKKKKIVTTVVALVVLLVAVAGLVAKFVIIPAAQYKAATEMAQNGQYDETIAIFKALGEYKDAKAQAENTQYAKGEAMLASGDYDGAAAWYLSIEAYSMAQEAQYQKGEAMIASGDYDGAVTYYRFIRQKEWEKEAQYQKGESLLAADDYDGAIAAYQAAGDYSDAATKAMAIEKTRMSSTTGWLTRKRRRLSAESIRWLARDTGRLKLHGF